MIHGSCYNISSFSVKVTFNRNCVGYLSAFSLLGVLNLKNCILSASQSKGHLLIFRNCGNINVNVDYPFISKPEWVYKYSIPVFYTSFTLYEIEYESV